MLAMSEIPFSFSCHFSTNISRKFKVAKLIYLDLQSVSVSVLSVFKSGWWQMRGVTEETLVWIFPDFQGPCLWHGDHLAVSSGYSSIDLLKLFILSSIANVLFLPFQSKTWLIDINKFAGPYWLKHGGWRVKWRILRVCSSNQWFD